MTHWPNNRIKALDKSNGINEYDRGWCILFAFDGNAILKMVKQFAHGGKFGQLRTSCLFIVCHRFSAVIVTRDSFTDLLYPFNEASARSAESNGNSIPRIRCTPTPPRNRFRNHRGAFSLRGKSSQLVRHRICDNRSSGLHCACAESPFVISA